MTEYTIFVIEDSDTTYHKVGTVEADTKEKAVRRFRKEHTVDEVLEQFNVDISGPSDVVGINVLAVPTTYTSTFQVTFGDDAYREVMEVTKTDISL